MAQTTTINVRVDEEVKRDVELLLDKLGMNISTVVNMLFRQMLIDEALPFQPKIKHKNPPSNEYLETHHNEEELLQRQKAAVKKFIESINAEPLLDDPLDEILNQRVNITRELDL